VYADSARSIMVGKARPEELELIARTEDAFTAGSATEGRIVLTLV